MKTLTFMVSLLLQACIPQPTSKEPPPPLPAPPATPAPVSTLSPKVVVQHFDVARAREISVVLHPSITAEQIAAIRAADNEARAKLTAMGKQGDHVSLTMLHDARAAVRALEAVLDPPQ